jgi:heat shock protein HslJ
MKRLSLVALALSACVGPALSDDIATGEWQLIAMEGQPVTWTANLALAADGKVSGQAPCNRYFGTNSATLPDLSLGALGATKMACPDLAAESSFFEALSAMTRAELDQGHLFLTGAEGRVMEFVRDRAAGAACLSCKPAN